MQADLFVSVDLDGLHHHLLGYGVARRALRPDPVLARALPRFAALFERLGVRATFFVVAEDGEAHGAQLRDAAAMGHEIASHSLTHPLPFASEPREMFEREVAHSRLVLERASGTAVRGFRAPGFCSSAILFDVVAAAGYTYDSSVLPSPTNPISLLALRGFRTPAGRRSILRAARHAMMPRHPYRPTACLWELPVSVTATLRLPLFHTPRLALGEAFDWLTRATLRRDAYVHYAFHGIDLLAPEEIDPALLHRSGARLPLQEKQEMAESVLRRLAAGRTSRRLDACRELT